MIVSMPHGRSIFGKNSGKSWASKRSGVTKYKVLDEDFVKGETTTDDGRVVAVIIRRGSLELPSPSHSSAALSM